jgi:endogenous inhibitor of DNA gyrase (YacG/DUF329 family)
MNARDGFGPRCPTCDMQVDTRAANKFLPFCSERCRLIDLGRWLNEEHTLTCEASDNEQEDDQEATVRPRLPPGWHDA